MPTEYTMSELICLCELRLSTDIQKKIVHLAYVLGRRDQAREGCERLARRIAENEAAQFAHTDIEAPL